MSDTKALLRAVLSRLDHSKTPANRWPDRKGEYWALCPFCGDDQHPENFSVSERGFHCFVCGEKGGLVKLARHLGVAVAEPAPAGARQPEVPGVTLADYARAKRLDAALLAEWGVTQHDNGRGPYLAIPYRDAAGRVVAERRRYALRKGKRDNRFAWRPGDNPTLYGLWRMESIRADGWVLLVEGESDCHTAWSYDLPALGVPGAQAWRPEWAEHLRGLQVFAWQEPDRGGEAFVRSIAANVPDLRVLRPPEGVKDLSDAHLLGHDVRALVAQLKASAAAAQAAADGDAGQVQVLQRFYPRPYSELLLQRYRFLATSTTSRGDFYVYDTKAGIWRSNAEDLVAAYVRRARIMNDEQKKRYAIEEIVADVRGLTWSPDGLPTPDVHLLPFSNGVYDLRTATLRPYTPDDGFTWQLPWRYNPDAHSDFISRHLVNFPDEIQVHFWELLAYCLWRGYPYQRFFFWFGRGRNGKTFLANIMRYALGVQHVAGLTLSDLQTNRFAAAALYGKLANIAGEVAYSDLENTDLLKKLVGDDWLQCERKYRDPVPFRSHAKLVFLANAVPVTRDTTDAFYRRAFLVQFEQQFDENPDILNQLAQLAASPAGVPEFEWTLANAVAALHDLLARHFVMTGHRSAEETRRVYEQLSNPLRQFLDECCVRTYQSDDFIYKQEFQERFNTWLRDRGLNAYSDRRLGREMKALGMEEGQRGEAKLRAWLGWRWV